MKFFDRFIYTIFSLIILVISITSGLYALDLIELNIFADTLKVLKDNSIVTICVSAVLALLSIKGIFFKSDVAPKEKNSDGILMKNENGKLIISRETIENIVNGVAKGFESTQNVSTKLSVINNSINVFVNLQIVGDVSIADLSAKLQNQIKSAVKKVTNLDLNEVNIRVKNITESVQKTAPEPKKAVKAAQEPKKVAKKEPVVAPKVEEQKEGNK